MKESNTVKTWEKTRLQNLVRHKSGRYYARLFLNGKEIWKSLKTTHFSIAEGKLGEIKKEHRKRRNTEVKPGDAKMTLLQAVTLRMKHIEEGVKIKSSTLAYWKRDQSRAPEKLAQCGFKRSPAHHCRRLPGVGKCLCESCKPESVQ